MITIMVGYLAVSNPRYNEESAVIAVSLVYGEEDAHYFSASIDAQAVVDWLVANTGCFPVMREYSDEPLAVDIFEDPEDEWKRRELET